MPINATFHGFIETTTDSLLLFEACRRGVLPKVSRRLQERERGSVKSGTIFIFDEKESGIKRWTDGLIWSPSRILGNFLIYRELGGRESLNEKIYSTNYHDEQQGINEMTSEERNRERNLVGSLTDTYKFRKDGLIKKTLSIQLNGNTQHLISYYTKEDVLNNRLSTPSSITELSRLHISPDLILKQSFRVPPSVEFAEIVLKRPSLSPSSTTSSSTSYSFTARKSSSSRPEEEQDDHLLYHSRRLTFDTPPSSSRKSARTSIDSTSTRRSTSYLEHSLNNSRYHEERETANKFRTSSTADDSVYETGSYVNNMPPSNLTNFAFNYDITDTDQYRRRRYSNSTTTNYPNATMSVSPPQLNNIKYTNLASPTYQHQQQPQHSSPLLSPSSFLWSNSHPHSPLAQRPKTPPPTMLTSGYKQITPPPVGRESSRYFENHTNNLLATGYQQSDDSNHRHNNNVINKNTNFY